MEKLYYTISEVAEILQESVSLVRFWANSFPRYIKPHRNAKGNRMFTAQDIETFKQLHYLIKDKGLTLEGAAKAMSAQRTTIDYRVKAINQLKSIRDQLEEIRKTL